MANTLPFNLECAPDRIENAIQEVKRSPWLTLIVPAFNEERTLDAILSRLRDGPYPEKEVIIVDDGSTDRTPSILKRWEAEPGFFVVRHGANQGKGSAVRTGLTHARGAITVIQDADLEYDPSDLPSLVEPIRSERSLAVYGSRYLVFNPRYRFSVFRLGVVFLNLLVMLLYWRRFSDEATGYKVFPTRLLKGMHLQSQRFELCAELTAKLCRLGITVEEIPISYQARTQAEGKKISWRDAWPAVWALLKWRVLPVRFAWKLCPRCADHENIVESISPVLAGEG
jgi:dolichol-phosphate mannosyltransferase